MTLTLPDFAVSKTYWATSDKKNLEAITEHLQDALNTRQELWQRRVDMPGATCGEMTRLFVMCALEYSIQVRGGQSISAPVEPHHWLTFLVVAENGREAHNKVMAEIKAHRFGDNWAVYQKESTLVTG